MGEGQDRQDDFQRAAKLWALPGNGSARGPRSGPFRRARSGEPPVLVLRSRGVAVIRAATRCVLSDRLGAV